MSARTESCIFQEAGTNKAALRFPLPSTRKIGFPVSIAGTSLRLLRALKSLKTAEAAVSAGIGVAGGAALSQIIETIIEQLTKKADLYSALFPLTFVIAGGELLIDQEHFELEHLFALFEKMTERRELDRICFYGVDGEMKELHKDVQNMPLLLMYALMKNKCFELYLCN
ncbi:hypothetical protein GPALN_014492 [Globodera pallida]|nr:hypothetical protein GPALN_014492 [Globodera pallida]